MALFNSLRPGFCRASPRACARSCRRPVIRIGNCAASTRHTVRALRAMSARDLADIGLSRCAIPGAAREHVYGK